MRTGPAGRARHGFPADTESRTRVRAGRNRDRSAGCARIPRAAHETPTGRLPVAPRAAKRARRASRTAGLGERNERSGGFGLQGGHAAGRPLPAGPGPGGGPPGPANSKPQGAPPFSSRDLGGWGWGDPRGKAWRGSGGIRVGATGAAYRACLSESGAPGAPRRIRSPRGTVSIRRPSLPNTRAASPGGSGQERACLRPSWPPARGRFRSPQGSGPAVPRRCACSCLGRSPAASHGGSVPGSRPSSATAVCNGPQQTLFTVAFAAPCRCRL